MKAELSYRYQVVSTFEHYTRDGKLVTTTKEKTSYELEENSKLFTEGKWGYEPLTYPEIPQDDTAKAFILKLLAHTSALMEKKIAVTIYESDSVVCEGSHY